MSSSEAQQIEELKKELEEVKAKNEKLEMELQEGKGKYEKLEKELRELKEKDNHHHEHQVNRHRRLRNLPAELKVEIVDCLPPDNAVHFLANVPNRLIIHHCAPRVRAMLKMVYQIAADYARTLPAPDSYGYIILRNGHKYTAEVDIFLRYGAAHCNWFTILRGSGPGFVGYSANFFDDLIKYYYETKIAIKAVHQVGIYLALNNPAPWPAALVQPQAGDMKLEVVEVYNPCKCAHYILHNKYNPNIKFMLLIYFQGDAKCYQQMTGFEMEMVDAQSVEA